MEKRYTQESIYKILYISGFLHYKVIHSLEKTRRLSNIFAIKKTWTRFNNQKNLIDWVVDFYERFQIAQLVTFTYHGSNVVAVSVPGDLKRKALKTYMVIGLTHEIDFNKKYSLIEIVEFNIGKDVFAGTCEQIEEKLNDDIYIPCTIPIKETISFNTDDILREQIKM